MKKKMLPLLAPTLLLLAAVLAGCNKDETDANQLPDGKHPLTLTATMGGLTATRATVDGTWKGGEEVAVQIGSVVKQYTANTSGNLTATNPHYWQSTANINVSAWIPYSAAKPTSFEVKADQSGDGYAQSDMLWSSKEISYVGSSALEFKHLPAKVVVNLKSDDVVTADEVENATVTLVNQNLTSGTIAADWTVAAATIDNSEIKTNVQTIATTDYQKTVQALVVPQQVQQGKQFIKVTIGTSTAERDYYYTPTTDATLESGKQHTYNITVKKDKLEVTVKGNGDSWEDSELDNGIAGKPTFRVTIPTAISDIDGVTFEGVRNKEDNTYEVTNNATTFSILYTVSENKGVKGFPVAQGLCDVKRTLVSGDKYTFTYSNIRSDLKLAYDIYAQLGDFYCKDGSGNAYIIPGDATTLTDDQRAACIGIIFWLGDITGDNYGLLNSQFPDGTHGLVVCKQLLTDPEDANKQSMRWTYGEHEFVNNWLATAKWQGTIPRPTGFTSIKVEDKMQGYANTLALQQYNMTKGASSLKRVKPICALANFVTGALTRSSGWYWPSVYELKMMCWGQGHLTYSKVGREMLNRQFGKVDGQQFAETSLWKYWASTEYISFSAWVVDFEQGNGGTGGTYDKNDQEFSVRPVLAF